MRPKLRVFLFAIALLGLPRHGVAQSSVKSDESILLFDTAGWFDAAKRAWVLPLQGWVFELEPSLVRKTAVLRLLEGKFGIRVPAADAGTFNERVGYFLADNEEGKSFRFDVLGQTAAASASGDNGHFSGSLDLPPEKFAGGIPEAVPYRLFQAGAPDLLGKIFLIPSSGISVISDVDDTIKVSEVLDRAKLMENTFVKPFRAVPGMPELYRSWQEKGVAFHYVSASPWQLYVPLKTFFANAKFPEGPLHLKSVRFTDSTVLELFQKNLDYKKGVIEKLFARYPQRRFILVGDDGEQDPEVYSYFLQKYPDRILWVYVRSVTGSPEDSPRFQKLFPGASAAKFRIFSDPKTLRL